MPVRGPGMLFPTITAIARVFCPLMIFSVKLQPPRMTSAIDPAGTVNGWQPSSIVPIAPGLTGAVLPSLTARPGRSGGRSSRGSGRSRPSGRSSGADEQHDRLPGLHGPTSRASSATPSRPAPSWWTAGPSSTARPRAPTSRRWRTRTSRPGPGEPARTALHSLRSADVAQLVEHFTRNEGVPGSSPGVGFSNQAGLRRSRGRERGVWVTVGSPLSSPRPRGVTRGAVSSARCSSAASTRRGTSRPPSSPASARCTRGRRAPRARPGRGRDGGGRRSTAPGSELDVRGEAHAGTVERLGWRNPAWTVGLSRRPGVGGTPRAAEFPEPPCLPPARAPHSLCTAGASWSLPCHCVFDFRRQASS